MIDDNYIINVFFLKNKKDKLCLNKKKILNINNDELEYLNNRYSNSLSIKETLYRIKNNIEEKPICPICGKYCLFKNDFYLKTCGNKDCSIKLNNINRNNTNIKKYGSKSPASNSGVKEKTKQTNIKKYGVSCTLNNIEVHNKMIENNNKKYGVDYYFQSNDFKEKQKNTFIKKYNSEIATKSNIIKRKISKTKLNKSIEEKNKIIEKRINTCLLKYNVPHVFQSEDIKLKLKNTWLSKYGVDNPTKSKYIINLIKQHNLEKYGETTHMKTDKYKQMFSNIISSNEIQNKINNTKKKNKSFNKSELEDKTYSILKEKYPDVIRQYRSNVYPFNCDFYVPSEDLYIECNYHWTHGGKLFEGTKEDILKLEYWKSKNTDYYNEAIKTWTIRDINKIRVAKENNLNYLIFYNINELKNG